MGEAIASDNWLRFDWCWGCRCHPFMVSRLGHDREAGSIMRCGYIYWQGLLTASHSHKPQSVQKHQKVARLPVTLSLC